MTDNEQRYRFGRRPPRPESEAPRLKLAPFLQLPPPPPPPLPQRSSVVDWMSKVSDWPMYANDEWGCCLVEGTLVQADGVQRAYRAHYSGPVLRLEFESGRVLTVTPNHAVLTPRGFVRARFLEKGDYAVRARRPEMLEGGLHFNQTPAPVEEVFAALARSGSATRQSPQSRRTAGADDFHGDARFFDGDVDVVDALGLLEGEADSTLGEPYGERKIFSAGQLERGLHGLRAALQGLGVGGPAPLGSIRRLRERSAFGDAHFGVTHAQRFPMRSNGAARLNEEPTESATVDSGLGRQANPSLAGVVSLKERGQLRLDVGVASIDARADSVHPRRKLVASSLHPPLDRGATDPELASDLLQGHPGLVEADRLIDVNQEHFHGYVYDLSTARRWYVANEIVVHNCVWAMIGHAIEAATTYGQGHTVKVTTADVLKGYTDVTGFDPHAGPPGDNPTDQGTVIQDALNYWRKTGIAGHRILAFAQVDHRDLSEITTAVFTLGHLMLGVNIPASAIEQFNHRQPWRSRPDDGGIEGGHAVDLGLDRDGRQFSVVTWGRVQPLTLPWWTRYVEEAWAVIAPEWLDAVGHSPAGLDLYGLGEALAQLTGSPNPFPTPTPTPSPVPPGPAPQPDSADVALAQAVDPWLALRHSGLAHKVAGALGEWKRAKQL